MFETACSLVVDFEPPDCPAQSAGLGRAAWFDRLTGPCFDVCLVLVAGSPFWQVIFWGRVSLVFRFSWGLSGVDLRLGVFQDF